MSMDLKNDFFAGGTFFGAIGMENMKKPLSQLPLRKNPVTAYHVFSTEPFFKNEGNKDRAFSLPEFELKTAELSALCWRRYNGPIYLVTDAVGEAYFRKKGLSGAYDGVLPILENVNYGIDKRKYWAASKIEALKLLKTPCAIIDLDLIVWKPIELDNSLLTAAHIEHIVDHIYPDFSFFDMSPRYSFPPQWDKTAEPLNTAFFYIADSKLKEYYVRESIRFMQFERDTADNRVKCMVFAEQRVLAMCAKAMGIRADTLLDYDNLQAPQDRVTHIWSAKELLSLDKDIQRTFIDLCDEKIEQLKQYE